MTAIKTMPEATARGQRDVTIIKANHRGEDVFSYRGRLVYRDAEHLVALCPWPGESSVDLGAFAIGPGDTFVEFYYAVEWFNVFAIYDSAGRFKGWYCNITRPAKVTDGHIRWHDLVLDLLVLPDGTQQVLDHDEWVEMDPPEALRAQAETALERLQDWVRAARHPFDVLARPTSR